MILNLYILYCKSDVMSRPGQVMEINKPWRTCSEDNKIKPLQEATL